MRGFVISNFFSYIVLLLGRRISFVTARTPHLEVRLSRFHCKAKVRRPRRDNGKRELCFSLPSHRPSRAFFLPLSPAILARKIEGLNHAYLFPNFSVPYRSQKPTGRVLQPKKVRSITLLKNTTGPICSNVG